MSGLKLPLGPDAVKPTHWLGRAVMEKADTEGADHT